MSNHDAKTNQVLSTAINSVGFTTGIETLDTAGIIVSNSGWGYYDPNMKVTPKLPTKVNFHPDQKATVLYFGKDKVVVRASDDDQFDRGYGFLLAFFQHHSGLSKKKANDYLHNLIDQKK